MSFFLLWSCSQESNFQKIQDYNATPSDTAEAPTEELPPQDIIEYEECPDRIWSATEIATNESCKDEPETSYFSALIEWSMYDFEEFSHLRRHLAPPMVGQLSDDNGDGLIDDLDTPDIVLIAGVWNNDARGGVIRLISGDGLSVHWARDGFLWNEVNYKPVQHSTPAIGDVDLDGEPEIVTMLRSEINSECYFAVIDIAGNLELLNDEDYISCKVHSVALSDLEGDGSIEAVTGRTVFNAADGSIRGTSTFGSGSGFNWNQDKSFPLDMDGDGIQEIIAGNTIYDPYANKLCSTNSHDGYPAAADLDLDGFGEMVVSGNRTVQIFDHNCIPIRMWAMPDNGIGGPPTIADYDGDGYPEIGIASYLYYFVFETDGTLLWQNSVIDASSNCTGSAVYDFEGDGYAEVVYADETDVWVYSGYDGFVKLRDTSHQSQTTTEYPVIVDVDNDGEVEIVISDNRGVRVLGSSEGAWVPARKVWNQFAYHITNINDDLTIPSPTLSNWPEYNSFRSGDVRLNNGEGANHPDAVPILVDTCVVECNQGNLEIVIQLGNQGLISLPAGVPISLYTQENDQKILLQTIYSENEVVKGRSSPGMVFTLSPEDVREGTLWVVVDDDGAGGEILEECNEENNTLLIESGLCP